jgi:hypothetical protein
MPRIRTPQRCVTMPRADRAVAKALCRHEAVLADIDGAAIDRPFGSQATADAEVDDETVAPQHRRVPRGLQVRYVRLA